jgi:hypothetical protein
MFAGCATLQPGADPLVVRTEQTQAVAKGAFDMVLRIDHSNREFWKTNQPAFHGFCEWLRTPQMILDGTNYSRAATMLINLDRVKLSYKANRGESNTLATALAVVEATVNESHHWILTTTTAKP